MQPKHSQLGAVQLLVDILSTRGVRPKWPNIKHHTIENVQSQVTKRWMFQKVSPQRLQHRTICNALGWVAGAAPSRETSPVTKCLGVIPDIVFAGGLDRWAHGSKGAASVVAWGNGGSARTQLRG